MHNADECRTLRRLEPNLVRGGVFLLLYPDLKLLPEIAFPGREDIRKLSRIIASVSCMGNQHGE